MSNTINSNNFYNSFFLTNRTSNTSSYSLGSLLGDYASIKNGSYGKLLKNYYAKQSKADSTDSSKDSASSKKKTEMSKVKSEASALSEDASDLYADSSLFKEKYITKTDDDGNKTTVKDYDRDSIRKKVKAFVDSYNSLIDTAADSEDTSILRPALNTTKRTQANSKMLDKVGIAIGKDNKLSIDEDKLNSSSINDLKSLFSGRSSYVYWVGSNASAISNYTSGKLSDSSLYTSNAIKYPEINSSTIEDYI